jgi:hypothetical protein
MSFELKYVVVKILLVIIIILLYIIIVNFNSISSFISSTNKYVSIETFEEKIEKEKYNYLKLKETYVDSSDKSLELLYANYYGEEVNKDVWENKTFDQCIDTCNKLENCNGFSRDLVLDTEPAKCTPITSIQKCYSNRKGNAKQMSKALKYNSYIKSNVPDVINHCIGDNDLTLNRIIYIKSYTKPNHYIGNNGDSRVNIIENNTSEFKLKCGFRIEPGKDGIGTVAFLHLKSNKYLYRNNDNTIIFKDINNNKTEDRQRASFNIYDGLSNGIMFKVLPIEGETSNKFMFIDNNYLKIDTLSNNNNNNIKELATFYVIDTVIESKIITDKHNIVTIPVTTESTLDVQEDFTDKLVLDNTETIPVYNKLFNVAENTKINGTQNLTDHIQDTYLNKLDNNKFISIIKKYNEGSLLKMLSTSLTKNQDHFNYINELNKEIEKEIANQNIDLNVKNDKIINNLDKMRITDLAKDYFFLKTLEQTKANQPIKTSQSSQTTKK